jgi:hypothetical protein
LLIAAGQHPDWALEAAGRDAEPFGQILCVCTQSLALHEPGSIEARLVIVGEDQVLLDREVARQTGLALLLFPSFIDDMADAFGNAVYRPQEIVTMMSVRWTYFNGPSQLNLIAGNVLESLKIADAAGIRTRPLFLAMAAGFLVSLVVGVYVTLTGIYHYGFFTLRPTTETWLESQIRWGAAHIYYALTAPSQLEPNAVAASIAGAAVALSLGLLRLRFWWWPFHPVGFLAANSWGMHWFFSAFFIGWLAKSLVTRYGGLRVYRQTVPLAIGLIGGELMNEAVWVVIRLFMRGSA